MSVPRRIFWCWNSLAVILTLWPTAVRLSTFFLISFFSCCDASNIVIVLIVCQICFMFSFFLYCFVLHQGMRGFALVKQLWANPHRIFVCWLFQCCSSLAALPCYCFCCFCPCVCFVIDCSSFGASWFPVYLYCFCLLSCSAIRLLKAERVFSNREHFFFPFRL